MRGILTDLDRVLRRPLLRLWHHGRAHECPVCQSSLRWFQPYGLIPRPNARCPVCGSLERHRFVWLFFERGTNLLDGTRKTMIHFAPERELQARLRRVPQLEYLTADLSDPNAMVLVDITAMPFRDESFDVVYCSHILEHVSDDRAAMRELRRVLSSSGWAVILVPITAPQTYEDPTVTDPMERERLLGQSDHVRRYGPDFVERLREAGFSVTRVPTQEIVDEADAVRFGVSGEEVVVCGKGARLSTGEPAGARA